MTKHPVREEVSLRDDFQGSLRFGIEFYSLSVIVIVLIEEVEGVYS